MYGIEIPSDYDGPEASYICANIIIEELAKVDSSGSVFCDVQNKLIGPLRLNLVKRIQGNTCQDYALLR